MAPYATKSSLRKFWHEDLARARLYNAEHGDTEYESLTHHGHFYLLIVIQNWIQIICRLKEGIIQDLQKVDNQEEIHKALNQDPLIKRINTRAGGTGEIAVLEDVSSLSDKKQLMDRSVANAYWFFAVKTKKEHRDSATKNETKSASSHSQQER